MPKLMTQKVKLADGTEPEVVILTPDGKLPYTDDGGVERQGDFVNLLNQLKTAAAERESLTTRASTAEGELAKWTALGKLEEVSAGYQTARDLRAGDLTKAEDVAKLRAQTKRETEEALAAVVKAAEDKVKAAQERLDQSELLQLLHSGSGALKKLANDKEVRVFADAVDGTVLHRFLGDKFRKNEKGEWIAYGDPGDARSMIVDPESLLPLKGASAVQALVEQIPSAKAILYNRPNGGGSGIGNEGGGGGSASTMQRSAYLKLNATNPDEARKFTHGGGKIVDDVAA